MGTELSPLTTTSPKLDVSRPERIYNDAYKDDKKIADQAVEARRKQFVEEIARQHGVEHGKLVIEKDSETGRFVHTLIDTESGDIIRQWPDVDWLKIAKQTGSSSGLWLDKTI
ncbi:flagellar protein FlaG [Hirschia litorea]|uniref:Flagellar protein FlaG n=1 Tax=Hirschia litorea TaxID=1199156 RepID=A0ABW2IKL2_9PROT